MMGLHMTDYAGDRGCERGWHGRLSAWLGDDDDAVASVEYHVPSRHYHIRCTAGYGDRPISASLSVGIFSVHVSAEHPLLDRLRDLIVRAWPLADATSKYSGRSFSLAFQDHGVYWSVGADDMGWASGTPRWRDGSWHPLGQYMRQGEPEVVETRTVMVPMPERAYKAEATMQRSRWGFARMPRLLDSVKYHVDIKMAPGEHVPVPGKGENSWDCGDDATFAMSCHASNIEAGVGQLVASALQMRHQYG